MQFHVYNVLSIDSVEKNVFCTIYVYRYRDSQCDKMLTANLGEGYTIFTAQLFFQLFCKILKFSK